MQAAEPGDAAVVEAVRNWLLRAVIGLNLCPFAKSVQVKDQIRFAVCRARDEAGVAQALESELQGLALAQAEQTDTTLLILPCALADFHAYNDFLHTADRLIKRLRLRGVLQVASFHPDYQFDGTAPDDIENYTNRSPYPILHLLREESIERALAAYPDPADIYERNQVTLRRLGREGWSRLLGMSGRE